MAGPEGNGVTTPWAETVASALDRHRGRPGALLPILHDIQAGLGYVPADAVGEIARDLNLSRAEVHGVVSFYHDFRDAPAGRCVVRICRAESCQAVGAEGLVAHLEERLGIRMHETTADGEVTLEPVYCLGNCALSPAATVDGAICGRVTAEQLDRLIAARRGGA